MANVDFTEFEKFKVDFRHKENINSEELKGLSKFKPNLEPNIVRYFFKNILGFNIEIAPIEKVYFCFSFYYKENLCYISCLKLSYNIYCSNHIKDELFETFEEINNLIENAFINFCDTQIRNNEYILPNDLKFFNDNLAFIEEKIIKYNSIIDNTGVDRFEHKIEKHENCTTSYTIDRLAFEVKDLSLSILNYIDLQFSKIEHLISLLYPLLYNVKIEDKPFSFFLTLDYRSKIQKCFPKIDKEILDDLSTIKEVHRNRFSHGLFSKEKVLDINIPNFGNYYMSVGKKVKGFKSYKTSYNYEDFMSFKNIFNKLYDYLNNNFPLQMKLINEHISVNLNYEEYKNVFDNEENTNYYINKYFYIVDMMTNMDW